MCFGKPTEKRSRQKRNLYKEVWVCWFFFTVRVFPRFYFSKNVHKCLRPQISKLNISYMSLKILNLKFCLDGSLSEIAKY